MSEFVTILIPTDESGVEIHVEEHATAAEQQDALEAAKAKGYWRDVIGIYRHPGAGPLSNIWWAGPSTIYERRYYRDAATAESGALAGRDPRGAPDVELGPGNSTKTKA